MGFIPKVALEHVAIVALLVIVALGAVRLWRQSNTEQHAAAISSHPYISLFTHELLNHQANDDWIESLDNPAQQAWFTGRRDGFMASKQQANVAEALSVASNPDLRIFYELPFLAHYLRGCVQDERDCIELQRYFASNESDTP